MLLVNSVRRWLGLISQWSSGRPDHPLSLSLSRCVLHRGGNLCRIDPAAICATKGSYTPFCLFLTELHINVAQRGMLCCVNCDGVGVVYDGVMWETQA